jgi:hypothetical protein
MFSLDLKSRLVVALSRLIYMGSLTGKCKMWYTISGTDFVTSLVGGVGARLFDGLCPWVSSLHRKKDAPTTLSRLLQLRPNEHVYRRLFVFEAALKRRKKKEQRVSFRFCFQLEKTGMEIFEILKDAFGDKCLSCARKYKWCKWLKKKTEPQSMTISDQCSRQQG